jgi:hypothetical protein
MALPGKTEGAMHRTSGLTLPEALAGLAILALALLGIAQLTAFPGDSRSELRPHQDRGAVAVATNKTEFAVRSTAYQAFSDAERDKLLPGTKPIEVEVIPGRNGSESERGTRESTYTTVPVLVDANAPLSPTSPVRPICPAPAESAAS